MDADETTRPDATDTPDTHDTHDTHDTLDTLDVAETGNMPDINSTIHSPEIEDDTPVDIPETPTDSRESDEAVDPESASEPDVDSKKEEDVKATATVIAPPTKKKNDPPQPEPKGGIAAWVLTFADLMSLLMAFFVLLYSMSEVDKAKFEEFGKSMKEALGKPVPVNPDIEKEDNLPVPENELQDLRGKLEQTAEAVQDLKEIFKEQIENKQMEVEQYGQIIIINLLQSGVFNSGSADVLPGFLPVLNQLSGKLKKDLKGEVIVSGHTDNVPVKGGPYDNNWELSAARASSVIQALMDHGAVKSNRFVLRGYADTRPKAPNITPNGRAKNRRVEILIDQRAKRVKTEDEKRKDKASGVVPGEEGGEPTIGKAQTGGSKAVTAQSKPAEDGSLQATADTLLKHKKTV